MLKHAKLFPDLLQALKRELLHALYSKNGGVVERASISVYGVSQLGSPTKHGQANRQGLVRGRSVRIDRYPVRLGASGVELKLITMFGTRESQRMICIAESLHDLR